MFLKDLKTGKSIDIFITRDQYRYHVVSKVEITDVGRVFVTAIASGKNVFKFKSSDSVEIVYKERDRTWKWPDVKAGVAKLDGNIVHYFESYAEGDYFNRRDTFRVQIMKKTEVAHFTKIHEDFDVDMDDFDMDIPAGDLFDQGIKKTIISVVIKDISESGIGFYSPILMNVGDKIRVYFDSELGKMTCEGTIVRSVENVWKQYNLFYGCAFNKTDKNLAKYIYIQQRLQLSKEQKKM